MVTKLSVEDFLQQSATHPVIDVRSPAEFGHAHMPGAMSLPLFSNEERAVIGTLYKQQGRETAMMKGLEYYGENMQRIIEELKRHTNDRNLFIYCWRGGMRSGVVAWMLDLFGFRVSTLIGGYKSFRRAVLESFSSEKNILILGGMTGSAKTQVLQQLHHAGEQTVDLEALAHHKGSAFGDLGESQPPSQEQFENNLYDQFRQLDSARPVWLEDESQRIGWVNIPNALWLQMRRAPVCYLEIPFEVRLDYITAEYGKYPVEKLKGATQRIHKRLGGLEAQHALRLFDEANFREAFAILLKYYDKVYAKATSQRNKNSVKPISSNTVEATVNAAHCIAELRTLVTSAILP
ncbi:MAG: tRNA 2-selenouridine(34) synthase MnmH [Chitinophagales bacterium]|nr:tRNA 2-selenouridine(34) synthase MnmH [Chitinophagales bacterium]